MDSNSLSHTKWNCKYHIVFAPKYRRKVAYGIAEGIATSIRKLTESMGWTIEQAMDALQIPTEERHGYLNMLKK